MTALATAGGGLVQGGVPVMQPRRAVPRPAGGGDRAGLRDALAAVASDRRASELDRVLGELRPMVQAARRQLTRRIVAQPFATESVLAEHVGLLDDIIAGLVCLAATAAPRMAGPAAPLTLVAVGRYGQGDLGLGEGPDLLALLPGDRTAGTGRAMLDVVLHGLDGLGFAVRCTIVEGLGVVGARGVRAEAGDLMQDSRYVAGAFAPWARLAGELSA